MRIFEKYIPGNRKINKSLLWEYEVSDSNLIDFRGLIAKRTIQMGRLEDFYAAFDNFGGYEGFRKIAKNEIVGLDDKDFVFMCRAFNLKGETTRCYKTNS